MIDALATRTSVGCWTGSPHPSTSQSAARLAFARCFLSDWLTGALLGIGVAVARHISLFNSQEIIEKLVKRRHDPETGAMYHLSTNPPPTEDIAKRIVQSPGDTTEAVRRKLRQYHDEVEGAASVFLEQVRTIDASGTVEAVFSVRVLSITLHLCIISFVLGCTKPHRTSMLRDLAAYRCAVVGQRSARRR